MTADSSGLDSIKTSTLAWALILFLPIAGLALVWFLLAVLKADAVANPGFWISAMLVVGTWIFLLYLFMNGLAHRRGWLYKGILLTGLGGGYLADATIAGGIANGATPVFVFYMLLPMVSVSALFAFVLASRLVKHVSRGPGP